VLERVARRIILPLRPFERGQDRRLVTLREVVDDAMRMGELFGGLLLHERREAGQIATVEPQGHGGVLVPGAQLEPNVRVQRVDDLGLHAV